MGWLPDPELSEIRDKGLGSYTLTLSPNSCWILYKKATRKPGLAKWGAKRDNRGRVSAP